MIYLRQIVGWAMSERNNAKLVIDVLQMAIARRVIALYILIREAPMLE